MDFFLVAVEGCVGTFQYTHSGVLREHVLVTEEVQDDAQRACYKGCRKGRPVGVAVGFFCVAGGDFDTNAGGGDAPCF